MELLLTTICGCLSGFGLKQTINWLNIDGYHIKPKNILLELMCSLIWIWAFLSLPLSEAIIFAFISTLLVGIGVIDFYTFQIPLIFILLGVIGIIVNVLLKLTYITAALWGIFVGAVIPLIIMLLLKMVTKRQGMGYGDIQMGIVLGAWLGPMRMAITLFSASLLSLFTWLAVSLVKDFDKDRALPMAPFLAVSGIGVYVGSIYYPGFFHLLIIY